jgi:hypothetical protein
MTRRRAALDQATLDYLPRWDQEKAVLRLTIPRGKEAAVIVIPFAALRVLATELKSDDEASMRDAFVAHAFALNEKLSNRVSLLCAGQILLVTAAMLGE